MPWDRATDVWDRLVAVGKAYDAKPAGMLALDVARIEAGLLLIDVDFHGSRKVSVDLQRYTPDEMGLGRLVGEGKAPFIGRDAIRAERSKGHAAAGRRPRDLVDRRRGALHAGRA